MRKRHVLVNSSSPLLILYDACFQPTSFLLVVVVGTAIREREQVICVRKVKKNPIQSENPIQSQRFILTSGTHNSIRSVERDEFQSIFQKFYKIFKIITMNRALTSGRFCFVVFFVLKIVRRKTQTRSTTFLGMRNVLGRRFNGPCSKARYGTLLTYKCFESWRGGVFV